MTEPNPFETEEDMSNELALVLTSARAGFASRLEKLSVESPELYKEFRDFTESLVKPYDNVSKIPDGMMVAIRGHGRVLEPIDLAQQQLKWLDDKQAEKAATSVQLKELAGGSDGSA